MSASADKTRRRDIRRAFGDEACDTIEAMHKSQVEMAQKLQELEKAARVLDGRTRDLRTDVNVQAGRMRYFIHSMGFWDRVRWLFHRGLPADIDSPSDLRGSPDASAPVVRPPDLKAGL